jgi:hypothetical protein
MCGRDSGIVTKAILEMVTTVLNSAFSLAENIIKMKEHGVDAETLSATIQVFIDMGKPFANPTCPAPEDGALPGPDVPPSPAPSAERRWRSPSETAKMQCSVGVAVFLSSFRHEQLQDNNGGVGFSMNKQSWEQWTLSSAYGEGKVFISSHRGHQLSDHHGHVGFSPNKQGWEVWTVTDAGDGKVFLTSHRNQQLKDKWGSPSMSWNGLEYEKWDITTIGGSPACTAITTTSMTTTRATTTSATTTTTTLIQRYDYGYDYDYDASITVSTTTAMTNDYDDYYFHQIATTSTTTSTTTATSGSTTTTTSIHGDCNDWCGPDAAPWLQKCQWAACSSCFNCQAAIESNAAQDAGSCAAHCDMNTWPWVEKCTWSPCRGCQNCE